MTDEILSPGAASATTRSWPSSAPAEWAASTARRTSRSSGSSRSRCSRPQFGTDTGFVQRFLKEARAAARLNHPNIVQIYDFGQVDETYYLAMEYVDGHSLGAYLRRGHFSERDAILVIRHACRALAVAHAEGLVHRDIKPDNLMLTSRGEVKLVDLGIAKRVDEDQSLTQTGQAVGTPHYISPEQIRGCGTSTRARTSTPSARRCTTS